jgi:hypothetical protein
MRSLTVRQPYAWAIAARHKDIENRSWASNLLPDEIIAIHAGARKPDQQDVETVQKRLGRTATVPDEYELGVIVATARVVGTVSKSRSKWFTGPLGWVLEDVVPLREPVACKGMLGLWHLPRAVELKVLRQVGRRRRSGRR